MSLRADHPDALVRIGELARQLGLTTRTLRYWEERSLIPEARRTSGGFRIYGSEHVRSAQGIIRLKRAGFRLDEIVALQRRLMDSPTAREGLAGLAQALGRQERRMRARIQEQQSLVDELEGARRYLATCSECDPRPFDARCMECLQQAARNTLPDPLVPLLRAAVEAADGEMT